MSPMDDRHEQPVPDTNDYLTPGHAARLLHVTTRTVDRWSKQGRILFITTSGGHCRFRKADIDAAVRQMSARNSPPSP